MPWGKENVTLHFGEVPLAIPLSFSFFAKASPSAPSRRENWCALFTSILRGLHQPSPLRFSRRADPHPARRSRSHSRLSRNYSDHRQRNTVAFLHLHTPQRRRKGSGDLPGLQSRFWRFCSAAQNCAASRITPAYGMHYAGSRFAGARSKAQESPNQLTPKLTPSLAARGREVSEVLPQG